MIAQVTAWRDEQREELAEQFNRDCMIIDQEANVERNRITSLIALKKQNFPRSGSCEDTAKCIELRKEINELDLQMREKDLDFSKRRLDLRYNNAKRKNLIQREWESNMGLLKMNLKKFLVTTE